MRMFMQLAIADREEKSKMEPILSSQQVGEILGMNYKVIERMARRQEIPGFKVGKFWRFRESDIERWIASRVQSQSQPCRQEFAF